MKRYPVINCAVMKIINMPKWWRSNRGFTLYKLVFISSNLSPQDRAYVIAHEYKHCSDGQEIGLFKFPYLYIKELVRVGYTNNKYEVEAREYGYRNMKYFKGM